MSAGTIKLCESTLHGRFPPSRQANCDDHNPTRVKESSRFRAVELGWRQLHLLGEIVNCIHGRARLPPKSRGVCNDICRPDRHQKVDLSQGIEQCINKPNATKHCPTGKTGYSIWQKCASNWAKLTRECPWLRALPARKIVKIVNAKRDVRKRQCRMDAQINGSKKTRFLVEEKAG